MEISFAPTPAAGPGPTYVRRPPIKQPTVAERSRHLAIAATSTLAVVAVIAVIAGYGGKHHHNTALAVASGSQGVPAPGMKTQQLQDDVAAAAPAVEAAAETPAEKKEDSKEDAKDKKGEEGRCSFHCLCAR